MSGHYLHSDCPLCLLLFLVIVNTYSWVTARERECDWSLLKLVHLSSSGLLIVSVFVSVAAHPPSCVDMTVRVLAAAWWARLEEQE